MLPYGILADLSLLIHSAFVLFMIAGLVLTLAGGIRGWAWIRNPGFRCAHLAGVCIVVLQSWFGLICPLTTIEMWLRSRQGLETYTESFIQHWLQQLLYYQAPEWVFIAVYTAFGFLVLFTWIVFPPNFGKPVATGRKHPS